MILGVPLFWETSIYYNNTFNLAKNLYFSQHLQTPGKCEVPVRYQRAMPECPPNVPQWRQVKDIQNAQPILLKIPVSTKEQGFDKGL